MNTLLRLFGGFFAFLQSLGLFVLCTSKFSKQAQTSVQQSGISRLRRPETVFTLWPSCCPLALQIGQTLQLLSGKGSHFGVGHDLWGPLPPPPPPPNYQPPQCTLISPREYCIGLIRHRMTKVLMVLILLSFLCSHHDQVVFIHQERYQMQSRASLSSEFLFVNSLTLLNVVLYNNT